MDRQKEADLSTPKDHERVAAYRLWDRWAFCQGPGFQTKRPDHPINSRTLERFCSGEKVPPPRLLEECAAACSDVRISVQLLRAADRPDWIERMTPAAALAFMNSPIPIDAAVDHRTGKTTSRLGWVPTLAEYERILARAAENESTDA